MRNWLINESIQNVPDEHKNNEPVYHRDKVGWSLSVLLIVPELIKEVASSTCGENNDVFQLKFTSLKSGACYRVSYIISVTTWCRHYE